MLDNQEDAEDVKAGDTAQLVKDLPSVHEGSGSRLNKALIRHMVHTCYPCTEDRQEKKKVKITSSTQR